MCSLLSLSVNKILYTRFYMAQSLVNGSYQRTRRTKRGRRRAKVEPSSQWGTDHRDPLVERQELCVDLGISEEKWEAIMDIVREEQVAPVFSTELDIQLQQRFGTEMPSYHEFWEGVKAVAVTKDSKQSNGSVGKYVPFQELSGKPTGDFYERVDNVREAEEAGVLAAAMSEDVVMETVEAGVAETLRNQN